MLEIPGLELETASGIPSVLYDGYKENFLEPEFANRLFAACRALPFSRPKTKQSDYKVPLLRLRMPLFARDPGLVVAPTMNQGTLISFDNAPAEIRELADLLSAEAGKQVEYLSLNGYENQRDIINWHQHREDDCRDARVLIVSLGDERTFGIRPVCEKGRLCGRGNEAVCNGYGCVCGVCRAARKHRRTNCRMCRDKSKSILFQPKHGSLINLANEFNSAYEHSVLADKEEKTLRISINTNAGGNFEPRKFSYVGDLRQTGQTEVVHCKRDEYDVYIGKINGTPGKKGFLPESLFANRSGGDYESYLKKKLLADPAHAARLMALRGKRLGCWCKGTNRDFSKCHGHLVAKWTDRIYEKWQELKPDKVAMRVWINLVASE